MDIYEVVKPFYVLSRLVGFSWFTLPSCKWKLPKLADAALIIANVSLRLYMLYSIFRNPHLASVQEVVNSEVEEDPSGGRAEPPLSTMVVINQLYIITNSIAWLFFIVLGLYKKQQHLNILHSIARFDAVFLKPIPQTLHLKVVLGYTFLVTVLAPIASVVTCWAYMDICADILIDNILSTLSTIFYGVSNSHILLSTWAILIRLRLLNNAFEVDCKKQEVARARTQRVPSIVGYYRTNYQYLFETIGEINLCYAWVAFFSIITCFLGIIATLFFLYEVVKVSHSMPVSLLLSNVSWLMLINSFIVVIVNINDKLKQEVFGCQIS